ATPGKMAIHGADSAKSTAAPRSISPQAAVGSWTPRPRKDSEDSSRMAWPRKAVSMIRYGAITLGSMCRRMMRALLKPAARAASAAPKGAGAEQERRAGRTGQAPEWTGPRIDRRQAPRPRGRDEHQPHPEPADGAEGSAPDEVHGRGEPARAGLFGEPVGDGI